MIDSKKILKELGTVEQALELKPQAVLGLHRAYLNPMMPWIIRFLGMHRRIVKAEGAHLIDEHGERCLDFVAGFGALNFGHEPREILEALRKVENRPNLFHVYLQPLAAKLAEYLERITPGELSRTFFCNSGAEGIEAAMKLARAATQKSLLIFTHGAFHGKTMGALSVSGREKYKKPFLPILPDTEGIPYGDSAALEQKLRTGRVAAFIVEPIQGEGGVIVPPAGYLKACEELCHKYEAVFIVDEIQTGMGRTGKIFCVDHESVKPDVLVLSKSLSGGVVPLGAMITTDRLWKKAYGTLETCLLHTTTFGGNGRACAAGIAAVRLLLAKSLHENAAKLGERLLAGLKQLQTQFPLIQDVRGKGLLIGMTFGGRLGNMKGMAEGALTLWIARQFVLKHKIVTGFTLNNYNVLRVEPPLVITEKDVDYFLHAFRSILETLEKDFLMRFLRNKVRV